MRISFYLLIFFFPGLLAAQNSTAIEATPESKAQALLDKGVENNEFVGVAAGYAVDGKLLWKGSAGYADSDAEIKMNTEVKNRIASITKPMTAVAIMQLYEQGKLKLDVPIQEYLPDYPKKAKGDITIRHLLNHTSGTGAYVKGEANSKVVHAGTEEAVAVFKDRELRWEPGSRYMYTTYGYVLLGLIIEKVSGLSFEEYLQKNIWDRAGMTNTAVEHIDKKYENKSALYHRSGNGKITNVKPRSLSNRVPGGGVHSTVDDLLRFADAILNNELITKASLDLMWEDPKIRKEGNGYGFGWFLYGKNDKYGMLYGHSGGQFGASTFLFILPEYHIATTVLINTSRTGNQAFNIALQLIYLAGESKK